MNSLLACSPLSEGYDGAKEEKIESLEVITLNDFDADHMAGSSIVDILTIQDYDYDTGVSEAKSVADYLEEDELVREEMIILKPIKIPELSAGFQIKVSIQLSTGESFEMTSGSIQLVD